MTVKITTNDLLQAVSRNTPDKIALRGIDIALTYAELNAAVRRQAEIWTSQIQMPKTTASQTKPPTIALAIDNHPAWIILDLAAMACNSPVVPLPFFFSPEQWLHAMQNAGVSILVTDQPQLFESLLAANIQNTCQFELAGKTLTQFELQNIDAVKLPDHTTKITYTSGTTGNPKGVCLSNENMLNVAKSIVTATGVSAGDVHLSVLPLATLLENVAGVYATLLGGASCILLPSNEIGLSGASGLDIKKLLTTLKHSQASTAIFTPELLHALVTCIEAGETASAHLRFLAVGGASVSPMLLERARS